MRTADFHYELPPELIAQAPAAQRDQSRLLVFQRPSGQLTHRTFRNVLEYLRPEDLLVFNDSKVIPARLRAARPATGGGVEILLVEENGANDWWVMLRPGKRVREGSTIELRDLAQQPCGITATVIEKNAEGHCRLRFAGVENIFSELSRLGEIPLPPYITRPSGFNQAEDAQRYQTVYARAAGSVAAPTAGLHFTPEVLEEIRRRGTPTAFVTLHVGLGTFAPVKAETLAEHRMHVERYELSEATAQLIRETRARHGRVIAVGTTTLRVLESVAREADEIRAMTGRTKIFIHPPYQFRVVDGLLTNFHLPESTLLMLVSAFAAPGEMRGRELMLPAYAEAIRERYRFFSYGDAMLIL